MKPAARTQSTARPRVQTRMLILAALFAALTAVGAFLKFPLGALSVTLQVFFTALAGVLLGPKWGTISQIVDVAVGLIGLPIFTMGGGPGYIFQPSFGFLLGLIPMSLVIGRIAQGKGDRPLWVLLACVAGVAVLYLVGVPYMYLIFTVYLGRETTVAGLVWSGMVVYLPGEAIKIAAVTILAKPLTRALART